jgi:alkanesulfonate monooxygenase SsuD/methylene tetrahydromethanopterin reductase-like flavin-dependent oxidoreductase (luciferase family)
MLDELQTASMVGSPETIRQGLEAFIERTGADELIVAGQIYDHQARKRSYEIAAELAITQAA